jgi:hypothetical protein
MTAGSIAEDEWTRREAGKNMSLKLRDWKYDWAIILKDSSAIFFDPFR